MTSGPASEAIHAGLVRGDEEAWRATYELALRYVIQFSPDLAERAGPEIAQRLCLYVHEVGARRFSADPRALRHQIRLKAHGLAIDEARRERSQRIAPLDRPEEDDTRPLEALADPGEGAEERLLGDERVAELGALARGLEALAAERLAPSCRSTLPLYFRCKRGDPDLPTMAEAARLLGIGLNTCWQRVHQCMKQFVRLPEVASIQARFEALL